MTIQDFSDSPFALDESGVYVLDGHRGFDYSDGKASEDHLERVLRQAQQRDSDSPDLEKAIIDWTSEYHLTHKRAHLLRGFHFDPASRVLEVGCGCGAVTRHLGSVFQQVLAVEGSLTRARLARLRTQDQRNVEIACGPFQNIRFHGRFDIVFCIGVFEYSSSFVEGDDPYEAVLKLFNDLLSPNGILVLAIENQFGLKYFRGSREDHLGKRYAGLEGYPDGSRKVRTFGKTELDQRLKKYFEQTRWFFPYPDYKIPDCVVSEDFLADNKAGELISQFASRDYYGESPANFDEALTALELSRNAALPFFANSFLVVAGRHPPPESLFPQLAVLFTSDRSPRFRTVTRIHRPSTGEIIADKTLNAGSSSVASGRLRLTETASPWVPAESLQTILFRNCHSTDLSLSAIFAPCQAWLKFLEARSFVENGVRLLPGETIDAIWGNFYRHSGREFLIDQEWSWQEPLSVNVLVIRAVFYFFIKNPGVRRVHPALQRGSLRGLITEIAADLGITLGTHDFDRFLEIESELQATVHDIARDHARRKLQWDLWNPDARPFYRKIKQRLLTVLSKLKSLFSRIAAKIRSSNSSPPPSA